MKKRENSLFFINFLAKKWRFLTIFGTKTKKIKKNLKILCKKN